MARKSAEPKEAAQALLSKLRMGGIPIPVERIPRMLDITLRYSPLDDEISGMIFIKDGSPIIGVNALHHPNRQRFTIAHELGHFELHRDRITAEVHVDKEFRILMRDALAASGTDRMEIDANQFAAELLIPTDALRAELGKRSSDIDDSSPMKEIAKKFRVSPQMLEYRIRNLPDSDLARR